MNLMNPHSFSLQTIFIYSQHWLGVYYVQTNMLNALRVNKMMHRCTCHQGICIPLESFDLSLENVKQRLISS